MNKLYVAYGSNLNRNQMTQRCPNAKLVGVGKLVDWQLIYRGSRTGSYATIQKKKGYIVPVVIWDITTNDEQNLDIYEGFPTFYHKQNIIVKTSNGELKAMVYIMNSSSPGMPTNLYLNIIYQGYLDNNLDIRYLSASIKHCMNECKKGLG